jgi:hypothetical protein
VPEAALEGVPNEIPQADIDRWSIHSDAPVGRLRHLGAPPTVRLSETPPTGPALRSRSATTSPPRPPAAREPVGTRNLSIALRAQAFASHNGFSLRRRRNGIWPRHQKRWPICYACNPISRGLVNDRLPALSLSYRRNSGKSKQA